jgi:tetratricopeptide (TPR) repeat protein
MALVGSVSHAQSPRDKKYPFANPPLEVYDQLAKAGLGHAEPFSPEDRKLLEELWAAHQLTPPKGSPQADDAAVLVHLMVCGGNDPKARAENLKKFTELVAAAKAATADAKSDRERADRLLRFLHKGVMAKGYEAKHTTLSEAFDTGNYNCVSSSAMYYLVGTRLGLKLQPILISGGPYLAGHAAVDLLDGAKRIEIEPTNPDGYDWPAKLKEPGVIIIGPQPDRKQGYYSDGFGIAASAACNLGLAAAKADPPRPLEAIRWEVMALVFAPANPTAENNLRAGITNWGLKLAEAKKFEEALKVYAFGRNALGAHKDMDHNYHVVWTRYLDDVFATGQVKDGLKVLARAAAAFPQDKELTQPAEWVSRAARRLVDKDKAGWPAALAFADAARKELNANDAKALLAWKDGARRQWSQGLLAKGDVAGSLQVLADGLAEAPESKELADGLAHHAQAATAYLDSKKTTADAIAHFQELRQKFPKSKDIREVGADHAYGVVSQLVKDKKYAEALKTADRYEALAGDQLGEIKCHVFDTWARSLGASGKWEEGLAKYLEGLTAYPKDSTLSNNVIVLIHRWAEPAVKQKSWDEAIRIYDVGLKHFPKDSNLKDRRAYCAKQKDK